MKHKPLVFCAHFFHRIEMLAFAGALLSIVLVGALLPLALIWGKWFLWLLTITLLPLTLGSVWAVSQCISSASAFILHQRIGTRASLGEDGLGLEGESLRFPRFIEWEEIRLVRRVYARFFSACEMRFRDEPAYQLTLKSGEIIFADALDEAALRAECEARGIVAEGFQSRLLAEQDAS